MRPSALVLVLSLLAPTVAAAQTGRSFELTPMVGYRFVGNLDVRSAEPFSNDLEVEESETLGLIFDLALSRHLQLELAASRQESDLVLEAPFLGARAPVAAVDIDYYQLGLLWDFPLGGQVHPFVVGSVGLARLGVRAVGLVDVEQDRPMVSFGGGLKLFLSRHLGLRIEGRYHYVALDSNNRDDRLEDLDTLTQAEAGAGLILAW